MYLIYMLLHIIQVVLEVRRTHTIALTKTLISIALSKPQIPGLWASEDRSADLKHAMQH